MFYIGTSNITLPVANKLSFPEAFQNSSRLTYYASLFNSLEINSSFYKIPLARTVERWANEVPENFRFTFKMNRDITHDKALTVNEALVAKFMQTVQHAGSKNGSLLIQFPGGTQYNFNFLLKLLSTVKQYNSGWHLAVEFRHPSWYRDEIYSLLKKQGCAMVVHDMPRCPTPLTEPPGPFVYVRFHGPKGDYRGGYELDTLERYAAMIKTWLAKGIIVYTYFNNTMGNAVFDALTLQELVTGKITFG